MVAKASVASSFCGGTNRWYNCRKFTLQQFLQRLNRHYLRIEKAFSPILRRFKSATILKNDFLQRFKTAAILNSLLQRFQKPPLIPKDSFFLRVHCATVANRRCTFFLASTFVPMLNFTPFVICNFKCPLNVSIFFLSNFLI